MSNKDTIKNTIDDVRDTANEAKHRTVAEAEHARRDIAGNDMTLGDKTKSAANELKNRAQAEIDKTKRELRHD